MIHHPSQHRVRRNDAPRLRVGAVQYLNTRPLVHGLAAAGVDVRYDLPSRLADQLASGLLDVALIPSIEVFRGGHSVVSNACIGCHGPVMSVKLFFRKAPGKISTLAVDEGSRTSAALARILLAERHGVMPAVETLPIGSGLADTTADAVLLIGDRAIGSSGSTDRAAGCFQVIWDLGDEWCRWTGLPFVFAVWAARAGVETGLLEPLLARARDSGIANLAAIAAAEAGAHGLTVPQCLSYLRDNLHYKLESGERAALALFRRYAAGLNLAPAEGQLAPGVGQAARSVRIAATGHERSDA